MKRSKVRERALKKLDYHEQWIFGVIEVLNEVVEDLNVMLRFISSSKMPDVWKNVCLEARKNNKPDPDPAEFMRMMLAARRAAIKGEEMPKRSTPHAK